MADDNPGVSETQVSSAPPSNGSSHPNQRGRGRGGRGRGQSRGRGNDRKGGRGRENGQDSNGRSKRENRADMGRGAYNRAGVNRRQRNDEAQLKRQKTEQDGDKGPNSAFSKEEIEGEERKPKKKVAVMIGYAGSGYKGMQINAQEKTIEGDIFNAFVKAGAISKANADDPKKSSLVRCARTDKGVHAAGNVISLKLIVEDPKIIERINENLPDQIRVWGIERTNGSFSCYQSCDSRWYEYLIPTFSFIPPHPQSYLARELVKSAEKEGVIETYRARQADAANFWDEAEEQYVKPILDKLDPELRASVIAAIHAAEEEEPKAQARNEIMETIKDDVEMNDKPSTDEEPSKDPISSESTTKASRKREEDDEAEPSAKRVKTDESAENTETIAIKMEADNEVKSGEVGSDAHDNGSRLEPEVESAEDSTVKRILTPLEAAVKEVKAAYIAAKKAYRISPQRRERVQDALNMYKGTCNFHNYTIQKRFTDPSAKRVIRSFKVGPDPVIINDTEWLSLKVHGQSFMMHQIRKMVAMATLVVRCGSPLNLIKDSYGPSNISIPKAPGLGLLLERPVFESYNDKAVREFKRDKIDFDNYQKEMDEFKQREIYDRIFREEERDHQFHAFFHHIDNFRSEYFLWVTATGISAAAQSKAKKEDLSDEEGDANGEEG